MAQTTTLNPFARAALLSQPDARLVVLAREGREDAFSEIVRRYRPSLVPFAAAFCPRDQAEDVVQESFTRAWRTLLSSDSEIHLSGWLHTIVRNRALNARRDTRVHAELDETIDGVRQPSDILLSKEELGEVVVAVKALPDAQREALVRSSLEGHSHDQIAAAMGTSPGAVRQLIYRARHGLRQGFGLLIPLPVLRAMIEVSAGQATAGAGSAAGAAAVAGASGGSVAVKAVSILAVGAAVAGSGIAIERSRDGNHGGAQDVAEAAVKPANGGSSAREQSSGTGSSAAEPAPEVSGTGSDGDGSGPPSSSADDGSSAGESDSSGPGPAASGSGTSGGSGPAGGTDDGGRNAGPAPSGGGGAPDGGGSSGPGDGGGNPSGPGPGGGDDPLGQPDGDGDQSGPGPGLPPPPSDDDPLDSSGGGDDGSPDGSSGPG